MAATKVDSSRIPKEILGDLQALIATDKKEYVAIGKSFYEVYPTSAPILMKAMSEFTGLIEKARKKKIEKLKELDPSIDPGLVSVDVKDLVGDPDAGTGMHEVLKDLLQGIDPDDMKIVTIGQMIDALDKAIKVNIETLPLSFREQFGQIAKQSPKDVTDEEGGEEGKNP